jgi:Lrp/AsnC family leucine-responsive transcriptional regulator
MWFFHQKNTFHMPLYRTLDKVDRKLLNLLQRNNQTPTRILAEALHISQPTCLRRIRELREAGVISAEVAMVNPIALGYGMLAFLEISLTNQSDEHMQEFERRMNKEVEVMQCYFVSGEYDYFLVIHVVDMDAYYQFVRRVISGSGNVRHFHSRFPMKQSKFATNISFDEKVVEVSVRTAD